MDIDLSSIMEENSSDLNSTFWAGNSNTVVNSTFRESLNGTPTTNNVHINNNKSFLSAKDFSISSIISNFSQLLDGNTSSSFLMHVDEKGESNLYKAYMEKVDFATQQEVLRRMSEVHVSPQSFLNLNELMNTPKSCHNKGGGGGDNNNDDGDSWDEFDKVMEKSLLPKDWELVEFEDLAHQSSLHEPPQKLHDDDNEEDQFMSAEEAKKEMDKEEELRAQFIKDDDATFISINNVSSSLLLDPLSMSKYFKSRSSFPVDNCANDSTMFGDETYNNEKTTVVDCPCSINSNSTVVPRCRELVQQVLNEKQKEKDDDHLDKTLFGLDPSIIPRVNSIFKEIARSGKEKQEQQKKKQCCTTGTKTVASKTPGSATSIHQYMVSSLSNGKTAEEITEYILQACRASGEFHPKNNKEVIVTDPKPPPRQFQPQPLKQIKEIPPPKMVKFQPSPKKAKEIPPPTKLVNKSQPSPKLETQPKLAKAHTVSEKDLLLSKSSKPVPPKSVPEKNIPPSKSAKSVQESKGIPPAKSTRETPPPRKSTKENKEIPQPKSAPSKDNPPRKSSYPEKVVPSTNKEAPPPSKSAPVQVIPSSNYGQNANYPPMASSQQPPSHVPVSGNPTYFHQHQAGVGPPQQTGGGGYSMPLSIHIHLPAFHPGMMYHYPPPPSSSQPYDNSTQQPLPPPQQQQPSNLPYTYSHPSGQQL